MPIHQGEGKKCSCTNAIRPISETKNSVHGKNAHVLAGQKYSSVGLKTKHGRANLIMP